MIDNATTEINQCDTADKTLAARQFAFTTQFAGSSSNIQTKIQIKDLSYLMLLVCFSI